MAEVVNLRRERKRKARADEAASAAANRMKFGASKSEKTRHDASQRLADRALDGARLTTRDEE